MNVLVTGATGFVGQHLVRRLLAGGHRVKAVARNQDKAQSFDWYPHVSFVRADIHACDVGALVKGIDVIAHLAWGGLPNYAARFHFEDNLPADYAFLRAAVQNGVPRVLVTGTCLEYGAARNGCLTEDMEVAPSVAYAVAKDALRRFLVVLSREQPFVLQWARLFYMHGPGQNPKSLLSQLERALAAGQASFPMSGGEQLRDYLGISEVAERLVLLLEHPEVSGVINCCSGAPVSVRHLVEQRVRQLNASIALELGVYPYPDYEPFAFWGSSMKMRSLLSAIP